MPEVEDILDMDFIGIGDPEPSPNPATPPKNEDNTEDSADDTNNKEDIKDNQNNKNGNDEKIKTRTGNDAPIEQIDDSGSDDEPDNDSADQPDGEDSGQEGEDDSSLSVYEQMIADSGIEFSDEEVAEILETEETTTGIAQVNLKIARKQAKVEFENLIKQYPESSKLLEYEMNGGDPKDYYNAYYPQVDYSELEISEDDLDTQKHVVSESLRLQGLEDEEIKAELEDLETAGILSKRAERSLKILQKAQDQQKQQFEEKRKELVNQQREKAEKQYEESVKLINKGEVNGIKIPKTKTKEFEDYIFKPVDEQGRSQATIDSQEMDLEDRLAIAYLKFSGYNINGLIDNVKNNNSVKTFKDIVDKSKNKTKLKQGGKNKGKEDIGNPNDIIDPFL